MADYMKRPCQHCPFRRDVRPFLHPERAEEIAYSSQNPYSDFPCHKTTVADDDSDEGEMIATEDSRTCAGWFAMAINEGSTDEPDDYQWPDGVYSDSWEMISAYEEEWER